MALGNIFRIAELAGKHLRGELDAGEQQELQRWIDASPENKARFELLSDEAARNQKLEQMQSHDVSGSWERVSRRAERKRRTAVWQYAVAASIAVLFCTGWWILRKNKPAASVPAVANHDAAPGGNHAVLTLSNGQVVVLDSLQSGLISRQAGTNIVKLNSGQLAYHAGKEVSKQPAYNTITTPRGGQYRIVLSDGTRVWLNSASSLQYPVQFSGNQRDVTLLAGEAYFEVVHHAGSCFVVHTRNADIQDIGTRFNVEAYADEADTRATLAEGSIRVVKGSERKTLKPGQQALWDSEGRSLKIKTVDTGEIIAWTKGFFSFHAAGIREVMRQLARWYDVDVIYQGRIPDVQFYGEIQRDLRLSVVLKYLGKNGIRFRIENKQLIISPNPT